MDADLQPPPSPVYLTEGYTTENESVIWVRVHDRHLQDITIARDDGEKLFSVEGPGGYSSMTLRRPLKDASGRPVFDLRRKMGWTVEDASGSKIAELCHKKFFTSQHTAIDGKILSSGALVEMRPRDAMGITNYVNIDNVTIAEISAHSNNIKKRFVRDRDITVFRVRVAQGVDLTLVVLMAMIRAEMAHVWQK
ncbi:hypothetical protein PCG10_001663 [Penicillium crustosum]|uniref:Tubby C-terminal-like domain-containing protein n=1 Tax=Penicillium crustosum TaxID=36656 RepID=A0A9P5GFH0_PENCR|nr:uncharacterized protein N7487_010082 [Penicillium crustosum]KAF7517003.1 hypothetical protein PCG10_001663 [Penicillium crustosum]KAJ5395779.1 hypothetical protein N7487_010082 [Penicillium crustosum]